MIIPLRSPLLQRCHVCGARGQPLSRPPLRHTPLCKATRIPRATCGSLEFVCAARGSDAGVCERERDSFFFLLPVTHRTIVRPEKTPGARTQYARAHVSNEHDAHLAGTRPRAVRPHPARAHAPGVWSRSVIVPLCSELARGWHHVRKMTTLYHAAHCVNTQEMAACTASSAR
jgi:hypothetical protein